METDARQRRLPARPLDRRVLAMWRTIWVAVALVFGLVLLPGAIAGGIPPALALAATGAAVALAIAVPGLRYRRWRYEIRTRDLFLARGSLFHVLTLIPFDRIQYVETNQGPLDLAFGLMQLVVYTAAGRAARVPGLSPGEAEALREELSRVAGTEGV